EHEHTSGETGEVECEDQPADSGEPPSLRGSKFGMSGKGCDRRPCSRGGSEDGNQGEADSAEKGRARGQPRPWGRPAQGKARPRHEQDEQERHARSGDNGRGSVLTEL